MLRLLPVAVVSALFVTGCAAPTPGAGPTYGSATQQQRMEQDTTMGGASDGVNSGQGYKGDNGGLGGNHSAAKF